ncbi:hypothetical protein Hanom_Chr03g00238741 [Helianthus anomalus]
MQNSTTVASSLGQGGKTEPVNTKKNRFKQEQHFSAFDHCLVNHPIFFFNILKNIHNFPYTDQM